MICTSSHNNWKSNKYITYAISGNKGKDAKYTGKCYSQLAPKKSFWKIWHNNIGVISEEENNKYYIKEYYNQVLVNLDPEVVFNELNNSVLLCYENNTEFCHRHIVAAWLELTLGIIVPEKKALDFYTEEIDKPLYIKTYLKEIMYEKDNIKKKVLEKL